MVTMLPEVIVQQVLHDHFHSRYQTRDWQPYWDSYSLDAFLVLGDRAVLKSEISREEAIVIWSEAVRDRAPHFQWQTLNSWQPLSGEKGLAFGSIKELVTQEDLSVVAGLLFEDGSWKVEWVTQTSETHDRYEVHRLNALSELATLQAANLQGRQTSLLEANYTRTHWLPRQRLFALPESRFTCQGTGVCCAHEMSVGLDENARSFVESVNWAELVSWLPKDEAFTEPVPTAARSIVKFGDRLARDERKRCYFLSKENRCVVHQLAGRAVLKPCHVFPYRFTWTPDGVCVTLHHLCPTVRLQAGGTLTDHEQDVRSRLAVADVLSTEKFFLKPGEEISWPEFRTIEGQLLELLQGPEPMKQKLWAALKWLEARLLSPQAPYDRAWRGEPIPQLSFFVRTAYTGFVSIFDACFPTLGELPKGKAPFADQEAIFTTWFRSLLFSKAMTYPYGIIAGFNYVVMIYAIMERQAEQFGRDRLSEAFWQEFFTVVTSGSFQPVLHLCHQNPATQFRKLTSLPQFGFNLLQSV